MFLERGAFDAEQARRYLTACRDAGLALRLHGDQFTEQGAIPLAVELGARSVDHLEATGRGGIAALAASEVTGVLLPASALFLGRPMPPARELVDAGAAVALATDFNPGSAFCESLPLVCSLAATQLKLSPAEALAATTVNAAHVLGRAERKGRIAPGLRRRPRAARRARLALPRLPPRPRPCGSGDRGGRANLAPMPTRKQQAPPGEGSPPRVRVRLRRRPGPGGRGRRGRAGATFGEGRSGEGRRPPECEVAKTVGKARRASNPWDARSSRRPGTGSSAAA